MAERKPSIFYYMCLVVSYLLQLVGNLALISLYPFIVLVDVLMFMTTFNYVCAKDDWTFWLTSLIIQFHIGNLCPK
jgi:hypothetical protein